MWNYGIFSGLLSGVLTHGAGVLWCFHTFQRAPQTGSQCWAVSDRPGSLTPCSCSLGFRKKALIKERPAVLPDCYRIMTLGWICSRGRHTISKNRNFNTSLIWLSSFRGSGTSYSRRNGAFLPVVRKYFVMGVSSVPVNLSAWWPIRGHSVCPQGKHFPCEDKQSTITSVVAAETRRNTQRANRCKHQTAALIPQTCRYEVI